jgi:predicted methyltransferase
MRKFLAIFAAFVLAGCQPQTEPEAAVEEPKAADAAIPAETATATTALDAVLDAQPDDVKARYEWRHPKETLDFFGIEPGMTVLEGLPGRGWYTKLLLPYLGADGRLIGANYSMDMWPLFSFANEEMLAAQAAWSESFPTSAKEWGGENGAAVKAFYFGSMPEKLHGTVDVVFFPRVLHNLARFQNAGNGEFLDAALADAYAALKPGGIFGVVQHHARDDMSDEFASGGRGYLKKAFVIAAAEKAGFEFVGESDVNSNPADKPAEGDIVWRLKPSRRTAEDDPEARAALDAIGESNRMTLKFRKPG